MKWKFLFKNPFPKNKILCVKSLLDAENFEHNAIMSKILVWFVGLYHDSVPNNFWNPGNHICLADHASQGRITVKEIRLLTMCLMSGET